MEKTFSEIYTREMVAQVRANPTCYSPRVVADPEGTATRFLHGFLTGGTNKDGPACKAACREMRIPHTYKAIQSALRSEGYATELTA